MGHRVKLVPPQYVKPFVKRGKNDRNDAEAICEAASRPTMRSVSVKTTAEQAMALKHSRASGWAADPGNQRLPGHAAEFGIIAAKGITNVGTLIAVLTGDEAILSVVECFGTSEALI
jgi:transposase